MYPATWERVSAKIGASTINYVVETDGTHYREGTPTEVIRILESARRNGTIIRVFYGDAETGSDWMEEFDTIGYVGRSMGPIKIPLLIKNSRSCGGGAILSDCIVRITIDRREVYRHPNYSQEAMEIRPADMADYAEGVYRNGVNVANFRKPGQAARYIAFVTGERNSK